MATSKTGVSIAEIQRELRIKDYKTVWAVAHKIRKAMADREFFRKVNVGAPVLCIGIFLSGKGKGKGSL